MSFDFKGISEARCVQNDQLRVLIGDNTPGFASCCVHFLRDRENLSAQEPIAQRGLPRVGRPDDGDPQDPGVAGLVGLTLQQPLLFLYGGKGGV